MNRKLTKNFISFFILFTLSSCEDNIPVSKPNFPALTFKDNDINGGSWKTVIINSPQEYSVGIPSSVDSDEFQ